MWPDDKKKFFTEDARPSFDEQAKALKKMFENLKDIKKVIVDYVKEKELTVIEVEHLASFVSSLSSPAYSECRKRKVKDFLL